MGYFSGDQPVLYDKEHPLLLLIDIKDNGLQSYQLLELILQDFREILCQMTPEGYMAGRVMVIVSGNRPIEYMQGQSKRLAFVDGRIRDLEENFPPELMPLISDRWGKMFSWKGRGPMPEAQRERLRSYVGKAHKNGQMIRFWATPDDPGVEREALWTELVEAGADLINTDDLSGLRIFFSENKRKEN
jgi:hypothetical protein